MSVQDYLAYIKTTQLQRVAIVFFIALLGIGLGVGFSVASTNARNDSDADYNRRLAIFSQWQMDLTSHFTKASSLATSLGSFVISSVNTAANMSAPAASRIKVINAEAYSRLGSQIYIPGITAMILAPGGVVSQMYPPGSGTYALDILNLPTYKPYLPTFLTTNSLLTTGPNKLATRPGYGCFVWFPIHVSNVTSLASFWGVAYVLIEIPALLASLNISSSMDKDNLDWVMWFTSGSNSTAIAGSDPSMYTKVAAEGMRMKLPISENGRVSYLAMYPRGGPVSPNIDAKTAGAIVAATVLGAAVLLLLLYVSTYYYFLYRHRRAPASHSTMYVAALALRGAQPIADRAPLVAVRMFNEFNNAVRKLALAHGCYPVCEIGDRCVYVASKDQEQLMALAQAAVLDITVQGAISMLPADSISQSRRPKSPSVQRSQRSVSYTRTATHVSKTAISMSQVSEEMTQSSFIGSATCHPSVACHTMSAMSVYDAARDVYFFGSAAQLGKLCGALDLAKCGEVCWTDAFEHGDKKLCRGAASAALTSHTVSENGEVVLHVASWWKESGDERDNEDPSTAMAVLSDAYMRRMTVIVSEGKAEAKDRKRKGGDGETRSGSSKSNEATLLTRTATVLHVAILDGDEKTALEIVRRIVIEEKGAVVSAHESTIVAAFNLLSAGGHHQVRAADTVMRLRDALPSTHFACSIQHGKIGALIVDNLVMCTGEAVSQGRALLQAAIALSDPNDTLAKVSYLTSDSDVPTKLVDGAPIKRRSEVGLASSGLCLLCCHSELSSTYDCEAVDVASLGAGTKPRIIYRLACRRSGKSTDDEWMYRMRDDEDQSPYSVINVVFARIASHDLEEAARLWREYPATSAQTSEVSDFARAAVARHLKQTAKKT